MIWTVEVEFDIRGFKEPRVSPPFSDTWFAESIEAPDSLSAVVEVERRIETSYRDASIYTFNYRVVNMRRFEPTPIVEPPPGILVEPPRENVVVRGLRRIGRFILSLFRRA